MSTQNVNVARFARNVEWDFYVIFKQCALYIFSFYKLWCRTRRIARIFAKTKVHTSSSSSSLTFSILFSQSSRKNLSHFLEELTVKNGSIFDFGSFELRRRWPLGFPSWYATLRFPTRKEAEIEPLWPFRNCSSVSSLDLSTSSL